jgi:plastocyanin
MTLTRPITARARIIAFGVLSAALILGSAVGCSSSSKPSGGGATTARGSASAGSSATTAPDTVEIKNFSFSPMSLTVPVGTKVTWKFDDSAQHTVSADDKSFVSPAMSNGQTYSYTFTKAGTYQYICSIHQYMKGTVVVQ